MAKFKFSGHETFHCRHFWPKKGLDFIDSKVSFSSPEALTSLGVGKNMVSSISFWLKAFDLFDEETSLKTELAIKLFSDEGWDPFLEDIGSLWILHYNILKKDYASIYKMIFQDFRKQKLNSYFTSSELLRFISAQCVRNSFSFSENSLKNDVKVFLRNYFAKKDKRKTIEDDFSALLLDLELISSENLKDENNELIYQLNYSDQPQLHDLIFFYGILDSFEGRESISLDEIQSDLADLFLMNRAGIERIINALQERGYVVFKEDSGRKELQIKNEMSKWDVLEEYYG